MGVGVQGICEVKGFDQNRLYLGLLETCLVVSGSPARSQQWVGTQLEHDFHLCTRWLVTETHFLPPGPRVSAPVEWTQRGRRQ